MAGLRTNIQRVLDDAEKYSTELDLKVNVQEWSELPQISHMEPQILVLSIYLYQNRNLDTLQKLKKVNKMLDNSFFTSKIIKITGEGTKEQIKILKAIVIKYLVNMITFKTRT